MTKGPHSFDSSLQTANVWLKAVDDRLLCEDRQAAYEALRAVLHVLRDRLPLEAVLGLSAQCPMLVRGLLLEGWRRPERPAASVLTDRPRRNPVPGRERPPLRPPERTKA